MKLSINNFKTIKELKDYSFNSINIISGVNSSGKTSFIQFLLLIKQTIEAQRSNPALVFDGNWINLGSYDKLVYKKDVSNNIGFELHFNNSEFGDNFANQTLYKIDDILVRAEYSMHNGECVLKKLFFKYETEAPKKEHFIEFNNENEIYVVNSSYSALFGKAFMPKADDVQINNTKGTLNTTSFFPSTFITEIDNPDYPELDKNPKKRIAVETKTKEIQNVVTDFFGNISYIGPLRAEPTDLYGSNSKNKYIGSKGEYAAQFLEEEASSEVEFYSLNSEGKIGELKKTSLSEAVEYWICTVFNLAKNIKTEKYKDDYIVKVVNHFGIETTIRHVGFGVSQILPVIVEGLRMDKKSILILEQPEIHLHPKIQSLLFDFIYSLSLTGRRFLIETHSDHFITRMRRRVAEDTGDLSQKINLVFVEQRETEHLFRKLDLTDMGTFSYFPDDFVEQSEDDYEAIVKAQAAKRRNKKTEE